MTKTDVPMLDIATFYKAYAWKKLRAEVLKKSKHECFYHRKRGQYVKATHVHHVNHVDEHPELALSETYVDEHGDEHPNLIAVCKECHETVCHPERLPHTKKPLTTERW